MVNPKPRFTGRFSYSPFGAGGKEPIYECPTGYQISMDQKECIPERSNNQLQQKVCNYLRKQIADENKETQQYDRLERDAQILTNGHIFLDVLMDAQRTEVNELKKLYDDICKR